MSIVATWLKTGDICDFVFIGEEVIAIASGNHVIFINLSTKEETIEYFNSSSRGKGASCLAAHSEVAIFCIAEQCYAPKIYIHTYPGMTKVAECKLEKNVCAFVACCFTGSDYLLSLTSFPDYQLVVWYWGTGEQLYALNTSIADDCQKIVPALGIDNLLYQFSKNTGKLKVYKIYPYSKDVILDEMDLTPMVPNKIVGHSWMKDNTILVCDEFKNIYLLTSDGTQCQQLQKNNLGKAFSDKFIVQSFKSGFAMTDENSFLTYFSIKSSENGEKELINEWSLKPSSPIRHMALARHKPDRLLIYGDDGVISELESSSVDCPVLETIYDDSGGSDDLVLIHPDEKYCALIDKFGCLKIVRIEDGSSFKVENFLTFDKIFSLASHPTQPIIAASFSLGKVKIYKISDDTLELLNCFYPAQEPLKIIKFSRNGSAAGVIATNLGLLFLIDSSSIDEIKIISHMEVKSSVLDFLIYEENETELKILTLTKTSLVLEAGDTVEIYLVNRKDSESIKHCCTVDMSNFFRTLTYGPKSVCDFVAVPYLSKQIQFFRIHEGNNLVELSHAMSSNHKLRLFDVTATNRHIISCGYDGSVTIREISKLSKVLNTFVAHHRRQHGTRKSIFDAANNYIVCLGGNGSLIGLKIGSTDELVDAKPERLKKFSLNFKDSDMKSRLVQTWIEYIKNVLLKKQEKEFSETKNSLLSDFDEIKKKIRKLLDENASKKKMFQIPISTFNLDVVGIRIKEDKARHKRDEVQGELQIIVERNNAISGYLAKEFWDQNEVQRFHLQACNRNVYVDSYAMSKAKSPAKIDDFSIDFFDISLKSLDIENMDLIEKVVRNDAYSIDELLKDNDKNEFPFSGSSFHHWVKVEESPKKKCKYNIAKNYHDNKKEILLKLSFNERFKKMRIAKDNLMKKISNSLNKLKEYKDELYNLYGIVEEISDFEILKSQSFEEYMIDRVDKRRRREVHVEAHDQESPDNKDDTSYLRWRDEIRKGVSLSDCIKNKNPEEYTEEDLESVKAYEVKLKEYEISKEKFKEYLKQRILDINAQVESDISDFDRNMEHLVLVKIKVQSAILQEFYLRFHVMWREALLKYKKPHLKKFEQCRLLPLLAKSKKLNALSQLIETNLIELKQTFDSLGKRNKTLDSKIHKEFPEMKQALLELLVKQFKRRPKLDQTWNSVIYLTETIECLAKQKEPEVGVLPKIYVEYLREMDTMDAMPSSLLAQIDPSSWRTVCKLRRSKVEVELKLQLVSLELSKTENTLDFYQKCATATQVKAQSTKNEIEEEERQITEVAKNPKVQLVVKAFQVEIEIKGLVNDCDNAVIVTYQEHRLINNKILEVGGQKLQTMEELMRLKKIIAKKEWIRRCLLAKFKRMKEHLVYLHKIKITKPMQKFLTERMENKVIFYDIDASNKMLNSVQKKFDRMYNNEFGKLSNILDEINYIGQLNEKMMQTIEDASSKNKEQALELENDESRNLFLKFQNDNLSAVMERNRLVASIKHTQLQLMRLQTELEILRLRTYPTLRYAQPRALHPSMSFYLREHLE